jgi:hypothetical protein
MTDFADPVNAGNYQRMLADATGSFFKPITQTAEQECIAKAKRISKGIADEAREKAQAHMMIRLDGQPDTVILRAFLRDRYRTLFNSAFNKDELVFLISEIHVEMGLENI